jgi:hypothetical protein
MKAADKLKVEAAMLILENLTYLDGHENLGAVRHELIEAHRLLGDCIEEWKTYQHDLTKLRRA